MKTDTFNSAVSEQVQMCLDMLCGKGEEYAGVNNNASDRLSHFKAAAALMQVDQKEALMGMASKHFASVGKMCTDRVYKYDLDKWNEKITDSINYLLILAAMVREEQENGL